MNEFYCILPSTLCPDVHPENRANHYNVSWTMPIDLSDSPNWKVGITSIQYNSINTSTNPALVIAFNKSVVDNYTFTCTLKVSDLSTKFENAPSGWHHPTVRRWRDRIEVKSLYKFTLMFNSLEDAQALGFDVQEVKSTFSYNEHSIAAKNKIKAVLEEGEESLIELDIKCETSPYIVEGESYFTQNHSFPSEQQFSAVIVNEMQAVFKKVSGDEVDRRVSLTVANDITSIRFINGLNLILGFDRETYMFGPTSLVNRKITAKNKTSLTYGLNDMYIYSNICKPMQVGSEQYQLLGRLALDHTVPEGMMVDHTFHEVMYVPVALTSINTIEITIKSCLHYLVPFLEGSRTTLTLHFKKE